jgi:branched-chain amino acid transport system ATP-binding protein
MSAAGAVEIDGITQRFGGLTAVNDVHVSIPAGETHGIIGPNGAGKTTLLNIISGLQQPTRGRVRVGAHEVTGWPGHRLVAQARVVRTFQTVRLFSSMSVRENVEIAGRTVHKAKDARAKAAAVLDRLGLSEHAADRATSLSYGLQRRVELARVMVASPAVVLLGEPAAGLSPTERQELAQLLREMRAEGITVVLVEHHMDLVHAVCESCTVLDFGTVISSGSPDQVTKDPRVLEAYLGSGHGTVAPEVSQAAIGEVSGEQA